MTKKYSWSKDYPVPAEKLLSALTGEEFSMRQMASQPNNKEGTYTVVSQDNKKLVYKLDTVEWAKTMTGGLDKSKTEDSVTTTTWDLTAMSANWVYEGPQKQAKVWGSIRITPLGEERCKLSNEFNVDISIPLIGGKIEKIVISEVEKHWPNYEALVDEFVDKIK